MTQIRPYHRLLALLSLRYACSKILFIYATYAPFTRPLPLKGYTTNAAGYAQYTGAFHSRQILPSSKTGFIVSVRRLTNITLLTLVQASSKGSRRPISLTRTHTQ